MSIQPNIITLPLAFYTGRLPHALDRVLPVQTDHVAHASFCWYGRLIPGDDVLHTISLAVGPAFACAVRPWYGRPLRAARMTTAFNARSSWQRSDEESRIEDTVRHLLAQLDVQLEVIVIDDRSTDRTDEILRRLTQHDDRVRTQRVHELPDGWLGKCYACHLGAATRQRGLDSIHGCRLLAEARRDLTGVASGRARGSRSRHAHSWDRREKPRRPGMASGFPDHPGELVLWCEPRPAEGVSEAMRRSLSSTSFAFAARPAGCRRGRSPARRRCRPPRRCPASRGSRCRSSPRGRRPGRR